MTFGQSESSGALKMVPCARCKHKTFIPGDLAPFATVPCASCGHKVMLPVVIHNFELRGVVGSGGMGIVYSCLDVNLKREVALKMMKKEMATDPGSRDAFCREARAGASLNHTNIIHIYSFGEFEGQPYFVMELADQGDLDQWIEAETRVPELNVLDIGIKIASALASALKQNLLHRDIKPGNILFNAEGEPKLIDFGLARTTGAEAEEEHVWGTPYYVAPEKINRTGENFLSDMYSLGGTLYHALTGHVPFEAPTIQELVAAHVYTPLTPPNYVVPDVTQVTSDALVRAMAKDPADRFQSYDEFEMALEEARSRLLVSQVQGSSGESGKSWWKL